VDAAGTKIKETAKLRNWTKAENLARHWDNTGAKPLQTSRVSIEDWQKAFLRDASNPAGKNLNPETLRKYKLLFRQLTAISVDKGYHFVNQLDLDALTAFRSTGKESPLTASKKLERLRSVLKFALRRDWIAKNPALDLDSPKLRLIPTLPFTQDEMDRILKAAKAAKNPRVHPLILTMRYSGLRISDTTALAADSLRDNRLRLHQTKTGEYVYVPIPNDVAAALRSAPHTSPGYFFWSGRSMIRTAAVGWHERLAEVFRAAKITNGRSHRFRDTFAVSLLEVGVSLESVSALLGHKSIRITEKRYAPWVKTRQEALDREILKVISS
jgi:integrase/recombinase XerD